jgi:Uma2 family endonuclease
MKVDAETPVAMQVSEEEFYSEEYEGSPYEYLGGELVVCEPVSTLHDDLSGFLRAVLRSTFEERGDGSVKGPEYPMRLDPKWSPEPDVMVVRAENVHRIGAQRIEGPADLVIEVASPGDVRRALRLKLPRYLEARIPEIWGVDPYAQSVRVETLAAAETAETPAGAAYHSRVVTAGRLDSAVFPGFWIDVSWLWQQPLPHTLGCVRQILG